jgi:hypothetical protein
MICVNLGLHVGQFGNVLGYFLTSYACAYRSRSHIIIINHGEDDQAFWHAIPKVVVHPNPADDFDTFKASYQSTCNANSVFPWDDDQAWEKPDELISIYRPLLRRSIRLQMQAYGFFTTKNSTLLLCPRTADQYDQFIDTPSLLETLPASDLASIPPYPDVLIHYRCSDNIFFGNMGLLPFHAILAHISIRSKFIFIITEPENRPNADLCVPIEAELMKEIQKAHPSAHVILRRGGDVFEIYAMLAHSRLVICSASSFCFYGASANMEGRVYLPTRPFYNSYINLENIHTMKNATSVYEWHYDGADYSNASVLTVEIALKILHDRSYQHYHPRVPIIAHAHQHR